MNKRRRCMSEEPEISSYKAIKNEREQLQAAVEQADKRRTFLDEIQRLSKHNAAKRKLDREARAQPHKKLNVLWVKGLTGKTTSIYNIVSTHTAEFVKIRIFEIHGMDTHLQRLIFAGKQLEDGTLAEYGITNECTLHLVSRCRGC